MEHIAKTSWSDIEEKWKLGEDNETWQDFYRKKGFSCWEDWRWPKKKFLRLEERDWNLEKPTDPVQEVGAMFCDASTRWTDFYNGRENSDFAHLSHHQFLKNHDRILSMRENFPHGSQLILLRNRGRIIVVDGHHRSTAIAGMGHGYKKPEIVCAISDISEAEFERLYSGKMLKLERRIWDGINQVRCRLRSV